MTLGTQPGYPGVTVALPLALRKATNVVAAQFDLAYNIGKVGQAGGVQSVRLTNHVVKTREIAPGLFRVLAYSPNNAIVPGTNGTLAIIPFQVAPTEFVTAGPIQPTNVVLARADATAVTPVTVNPGTIFVRPVNRRSDGIVDFFLPSQADQRYLIQATTDFVRWETIGTNVAAGDFMALVDSDGPNYPYRFYRWLLYDAAGETAGIEPVPAGGVSFRVNGRNGRLFQVQASTNLVDWLTIATQPATNGRIDFTDPDAPIYRQRFYRLRSGN